MLYGLDRHEQYRNSHDNPQIKKIYADYFGEPNSELAEHLLHTDLHGWWMPGEKEALEAWKAKH